MKSKQVLIYDAFTNKPFQGNPCAILPDANGLTDAQMAEIAREMNLPETSFVLSSDQADYKVRYFTPRYEINFAGHPTIATVAMLVQEGLLKPKNEHTELKIEFNVGVLPVSIYMQAGKLSSVVMTQQKPFYGKKIDRDTLAKCFSDLAPEDLYDGSNPQVVGTGTNFLIMVLNSFEKLKNLEMRREPLTKLLTMAGVNAVYALALDGFSPDTDFHGRLQDPQNAFEDPYTGSAVGAAGAYLINYGLVQKERLVVEQGHFVNRPGIGELIIGKNPDNSLLIKLSGTAVKVMDGNIELSS